MTSRWFTRELWCARNARFNVPTVALEQLLIRGKIDEISYFSRHDGIISAYNNTVARHEGAI
jgi:hypothetical protein